MKLTRMCPRLVKRTPTTWRLAFWVALLLPIALPAMARQDPATDATKPCEVVVLNFEPKGLPANEAHIAEIVTNTFAAEVAAQASCKVITQSDIRSMTEFDAQRTLCGSQESCMAEIGSALGVDIVIGGALGKLGDAYTLQIMKRNVTKGTVDARSDDTITGGAPQLQDAARNAARKLYGIAPLATAAPADSKGSSATQAATVDDEGSSGSGLLFAGIGIGAAGALAVAAGATTALVVDAVVIGDKSLPGPTKDTAAIAGIAALGTGVVVGVLGLATGGVLAGIGAMSE